MQYQEVEDALPHILTGAGRATIEAFCALPGATEWCPAKLQGLQFDYISYLGLPFSLIGECPTVRPQRAKFEEYVKNGVAPPRGLYAEIQAAGILCHLGASVEFIPTIKGKRTPDLRASWEGDHVDVEVTAAEQKQLHTAARAGLNTLAGAIQCGDIEGHVHAYVRDASDPDSLTQLLEAAIGLQPGNHGGNDKWFVAITSSETDGMSSPMPTWWDQDAPKYFVQSTAIGNGKSMRVVLQSLVPLASYINPIKNKAERVQSELQRPFLIAVDVGTFPDAHLQLPEEILKYFPAWDHLSGVILFSNRFWSGFEKKEWHVTLVLNPHATRELPTQLLQYGAGKLFVLAFNLCTSESNPRFDNRYGYILQPDS